MRSRKRAQSAHLSLPETQSDYIENDVASRQILKRLDFNSRLLVLIRAALLGFLCGVGVVSVYYIFKPGHIYKSASLEGQIEPLSKKPIAPTLTSRLSKESNTRTQGNQNQLECTPIYQARVVKGSLVDATPIGKSETECCASCLSLEKCAIYTFSHLTKACFLYSASGLDDSASKIQIEKGVAWHVSGITERFDKNLSSVTIRRRDASWFNPKPKSYKRYFKLDYRYKVFPKDGLPHWKERKDYRNQVRQALEKNGLTITTGISRGPGKSKSKWNFYWGLQWKKLSDFESAQLLPDQHINMLPGAAKLLLGDKDAFHQSAARARERFGASEIDSFVPWSFLIGNNNDNATNESVLLEQRIHDMDVAKIDVYWIWKELSSWSGDGVSVLSSDDALKKAHGLASAKRKAVAQKYIHNPLTLVGYKFDTRWWALITSITPLRVYMLPDAYVRVASASKYDPSPEYFSNKCMHITNGKVQNDCKDNNNRHGHKRQFPSSIQSTYFQKMLADSFGRPVSTESEYFLTANLFKKTQEAILKSILMVLSDLRKYKEKVTKARCFQLLSYDIIYDDVYGVPWVEEVNTNGFLGGGIYALRKHEDFVWEMFRLVGANGYERKRYARKFEEAVLSSSASRIQNATAQNLASLQDAKDEYVHRGHWISLFPPLNQSDLSKYSAFLSPEDIEDARLTSWARSLGL